MNKEEAIRRFTEASDLADRARTTLEAVLRQNPAGILFVWETDEGFYMTTAPFSKALASGLVSAAVDILNPEIEEDSEDEE